MAKRELERVADGVWLLRGGVPRTMNVYLLEDEGGGVTLFDAGIRSMTHALAEAAAPLGGINRIVLGHADADHRGAALGPARAGPLPSRRSRGGRERRAAARLPPARPARHPGALRLPAPAELLGRRRRGDRRHGRGGRRRERLPRRAPARARAGADRPVPRVRPAGADQRLLLRDRPRDLAARRRRGRRTRPSTRTPSRRAPRSASWPRSSPSAAWPGHARRADRRRARASSSAPPRRDGAQAAEGARQSSTGRRTATCSRCAGR